MAVFDCVIMLEQKNEVGHYVEFCQSHDRKRWLPAHEVDQAVLQTVLVSSFSSILQASLLHNREHHTKLLVHQNAYNSENKENGLQHAAGK